MRHIGRQVLPTPHRTASHFRDRLCEGNGLDEGGRWSIHGFYEPQFNDALNFNLSENTVSLITAVLTSLSLLLFMDIVFRATVRARRAEVSKRVILRRHLLDTFSNPINLLSLCVSRCQRAVAKPERAAANMQQSERLRSYSTCKYATLVFVGVFTLCVEFLFIFLATNQNRVYQSGITDVPVLEFEDRGCDIIFPHLENTCSNQGPLTEKSGFQSQADMQICLTNTFLPSSEDANVLEDNQMMISVQELESYFFDVTLTDSDVAFSQKITIGLLLKNGRFYAGTQNATEEQIESALLARLRRSNASILLSTTSNNFSKPINETRKTERRLYRPSTFSKQANSKSVTVFIDVRYINLRETYAWDVDANKKTLRFLYISNMVRSVMFPTGRGAGVALTGDGYVRLEDEASPLAFYNRPWMGIVPSLIICFVLLVVWLVLTARGIEGGVDARWAWKEFFTDTLSIDDFGRGVDEWQDMHWRSSACGNTTYGFTPVLLCE